MRYFTATALLALLSAVHGMQYRDNQVWFVNYSDEGAAEEWSGGSFNVSMAVIPDGQDPLRYHNDTHNRVHILQNIDKRLDSFFTFIVGRHGSSEVANFWNVNITAGRCTFRHNAEKLNFAFLGDLRLELPIPPINLTFPAIALAQGHMGASNNWWFGGQNCGSVDGRAYSVLCPGFLDNGTAISAYFKRGKGKPSNVVLNEVMKNRVHFNKRGEDVHSAEIVGEPDIIFQGREPDAEEEVVDEPEAI